MQYRVLWMRRDQTIDRVRFDNLDSARVHAEEQFPNQRKQNGVDRVEVRDETDRLVFDRSMSPGEPVNANQ